MSTNKWKLLLDFDPPNLEFPDSRTKRAFPGRVSEVSHSSRRCNFLEPLVHCSSLHYYYCKIVTAYHVLLTLDPSTQLQNLQFFFVGSVAPLWLLIWRQLVLCLKHSMFDAQVQDAAAFPYSLAHSQDHSVFQLLYLWLKFGFVQGQA